MNKIIMLGTGNGGTTRLFNTCFVIKNDIGDFLIDTGGGIEILNRLQKSNIDYKSIKHIFISHSHTDHILGIFWIFKKLSRLAMHGEISQKINLYCNDVVYEAITQVSKYILPQKLMEAIYSAFNFVILNSGDRHIINDVTYTFFDIHAKGTKQFGFECLLDGKKLVFLGDETINPIINNIAQNANFVMHEAFCLDWEENKFHAYEKNHSTVKSASQYFNNLNVKNLILYHTEDSHGNDRQKLYMQEATQYFAGNVIVPNELETIEI